MQDHAQHVCTDECPPGDVMTQVTPEQELEAFGIRLQGWLAKQPDVHGVELVGSGEETIFGFELAGAGPISLSYNITP